MWNNESAHPFAGLILVDGMRNALSSLRKTYTSDVYCYYYSCYTGTSNHKIAKLQLRTKAEKNPMFREQQWKHLASSAKHRAWLLQVWLQESSPQPKRSPEKPFPQIPFPHFHLSTETLFRKLQAVSFHFPDGLLGVSPNLQTFFFFWGGGKEIFCTELAATMSSSDPNFSCPHFACLEALKYFMVVKYFTVEEFRFRTTLKGSLSSKQMKKACNADLQLRGSL